MYRVALFIVAIVLLIGCLRPFVEVAYWIGHFELTVVVEADPAVDVDSIRFYEGWNREISEWLLTAPKSNEAKLNFDRIANSSILLRIKCYGKDGFFDYMDTYHQPDTLVVEFTRHTEDGPQVARKLLPIPEGRGARSVILTLP